MGIIPGSVHRYCHDSLGSADDFARRPGRRAARGFLHVSCGTRLLASAYSMDRSGNRRERSAMDRLECR